MRRWIATSIILIIIITAVIWEQIFVSQTFKTLDNKLQSLIASVEISPEEEIDTSYNINTITDLQDYWLEKERVLCYLVRHSETFQISDSILYAKNFIILNNKEEALFALSKLNYLFDVYNYNIGFSLENII